MSLMPLVLSTISSIFGIRTPCPEVTSLGKEVTLVSSDKRLLKAMCQQ